MKLLNHKYSRLILAGGALVLLIAVSLFLFTPREWPSNVPELALEDIEILPVNSDSYGVDIHSDFIVKATAGFPIDKLLQMIRTVPSVDFSLTMQTAGEYLLKLGQALKPHSMFSVVLAGEDSQRSWAFQTKNKFRIVATLPTDGASYAPIDRGIEIVFSHKDVTEPSDFFQIAPLTEGWFEQHGATWVFVPNEALLPDTLYEVHIAEELSGANGEALGEPYSFTFKTAPNYVPTKVTPLSLAGNYMETFIATEIPLVELYYHDSKWQDISFQVDVHALATEDNFLSALELYHDYCYGEGRFAYNQDSFLIDPKQLDGSKITTFETNILRVEDSSSYYYSHSYIILPETLAPGWYLIDIHAPEDADRNLPATAMQKLIQVHNSAVYLHTTYQNALLWLNDTQTGASLAGKEVQLNGASLGRTDDQGVAVIATPEQWSSKDFAYIKIVDPSTIPFLTPITLYGANEEPHPEELYSSYIYTDRSAYLPSDKVQVWGVIRSRTGQPLPSEAVLTLSTWRYSKYASISRGFLDVPVKLSQNGIFTAEIPLENLASASYDLQLYFPEHTEAVARGWFTVMEYVKPTYTGDIRTTKPYYFSWEAIDVEGEVAFFDGTPASGMPLALNIHGYPYIQQQFSATSDVQGKVSFSFLRTQTTYDYLASNKPARGWRPIGLSCTLQNTAAEDTTFSLNCYAPLFEADTMLRAAWDPQAKTVVVQSNRIDLAGILESDQIYEDDYRLIQGEEVDIPFSLEIHEVVWNKIETGRIYDFINKQTVTQYHYEREDKVIQTLSGATHGGVATLTDITFSPSDLSYYYGKLTYSDSRGTELEEHLNMGREIYRYYDDPLKNYGFDYEEWSLGADQSTMISLMENSVALNNPDGRILYTVLQSPQGYLGHNAVDGTQFTFTFNQEYIPCVQLEGAYFDGKHVYPIWAQMLSYNPQERRLNLNILSDRENYQPGDTVTLEIGVTNLEGRPTSADLYISVVDEAAFAIRAHEASPLFSLYRNILAPSSWSYVSYVQHTLGPNTMAEKGGGDGTTSARHKFLDNAFSLATTSDPSGRATVSFQLPDNLTSWRITVQAVSETLSAGDGKTNITTRIPFFVDLLQSRTYLVGDDLTFSLRAFGTALQGSEDVSFRAVLVGEDQQETELELTAQAGEYANLNFGSLAAGNYTVRAYASCGEYSDALEKSVRVVNHAVELPLTTELDPKQLDVDALRDPITLVFYDKVRELQMRSAFHLLSNPGQRVDQLLGAAQALTWLSRSDDSEDAFLGNYALDDLSIEQGYQGGVRLLPDAEEDPIFTAKICVAAPEYLNKLMAIEYLYTVIDNPISSSEQVAAAYMGLAALREPVLLDLHYLTQHPDGLEKKDLLYLCAALALLGDESAAKEQYEKLIRPISRSLDPWLHLESGEGSDADLEWTALASLSALFVDRDAASQMVSYLLDHASEEALINLEIIAFLRLYLPHKTEPARFSYQYGGQTLEVSLDERWIYFQEFTQKQLSEADIHLLSGELGLTASYIGSAEEILNEDAIRAKVSKTIEAVDGGPIQQSDLVKITLTVEFDEDAPLGGYYLTDTVPSGMRFTYIDYNWGSNIVWWLQRQEGQRVVFHGSSHAPAPHTVVYYARAVLPGTFLSESAYLQNLNTAAWGQSPRETVVILEAE